MPFIESSRTLTSKLHASDMPSAARAGIALATVAVVGLGGYNLVQLAGADTFTLDSTVHEQVREPDETGDAADRIEPPSAASLATSEQAAQTSSSVQTELQQCFVFVSGAVQNPGVYELPATSRVNDAVQAAGGFTDNASLDAVNLARIIEDGEQIAIPTQDEIEALNQGQPQSEAIVRSVNNAGQAGAQEEASALVNLNTASQEELESLPGIGPATATKIIASREAEGPFAAPEDIMRVSGIGQKKYESIQDLICV